MLDKCANPACSAKFMRLHDGRLFVTDLKGNGKSTTGGDERQLEYFWLCSSCCRTMTVAVEKGQRPRLVSLREPAAAVRRAS